MALSIQSISARRAVQPTAQQVMFRVSGLYGLCPQGVRIPLSTRDSMDSGPICLTIDPEADLSSNVGLIDYPRRTLRVRYGVQLIFPALHELVTSGNYDLSLLRPPRAVATDDCTVTDNYSGWHALGCFDFLPGSVWSGATGG